MADETQNDGPRTGPLRVPADAAAPPRRRMRSRTMLLLAVVAAALLASGCEGVIYIHSDNARAAVSLPPLGRVDTLQQAARANAADLCAAGAATPSPDPETAYDQQTIAGAHELVGAAPLDPAITDPDEQNQAATRAIWAGWEDDPAWTDARWDDLGVGEATCPDGSLYLTAVMTERPSMPATGRYSSLQHTTAQLQAHLGLQYGSAVNHLGQNEALLLDLYLPPTPGPRPLVIIVHGGGFHSGTREGMTTTAQNYARRGFAAATISYRLNPTLKTNPDPGVYLQTARNAIDDGMESVRWLRANAATYGIDSERIAMLGSSAGGGIALGVATADDPTPTGPLAATSPKVRASVSTGASLTIALDQVVMSDADAPILMFHYETDTSTDATDEYAMETCTALRDAGGTCDFVLQPGVGHTVSISGGGPYWTPNIGPFLWEHLDLG